MRRFSFSISRLSLVTYSKGVVSTRVFRYPQDVFGIYTYRENSWDKPRVKLKNDRDVRRAKLGRRLNIKQIIKSNLIGFISGERRHKPLRHNQYAAKGTSAPIRRVVRMIDVELAKSEPRLKIPERYKASICNLERNWVRM